MNSEDLIAIITPRKPSACSCKTCALLCQIAPCLGTPADIALLIGKGYGDQLCFTEWAAGSRIGIPVIPMVQIRMTDTGGCPLFRKGLCSIHEIKPTSGRLATHEAISLAQSPDTAVALTWLLPANAELVAAILEAYE